MVFKDKLNSKILASKSGFHTGNINNITENGIYTCTDAATNIPIAEYGYLMHIETTGGKLQMYFSIKTFAMYSRTFNNGAWQVWKNR